MNEHIKRLAEQATKVFEPNDPDYRYESFDKNKFAKLIVQEVLSVQEQLIAKGHNAWHLYDLTKEHFGMK